IVFHDDPRHHLWCHVVTIGVVLAVDRVRVDVILRYENKTTSSALRETGENLNFFGSTRRGRQFSVGPLWRGNCKLMRTSNVARDCRRGNHLWTCEIALGVSRSHATLEISIGRGNSHFSWLKQAHSQADARPATRRQRVRASVHEDLPCAALFGF